LWGYEPTYKAFMYSAIYEFYSEINNKEDRGQWQQEWWRCFQYAYEDTNKQNILLYLCLEFIINIALEIDNQSSNTYIMHFVKYFWSC
jgi:hypothetical protein